MGVETRQDLRKENAINSLINFVKYNDLMAKKKCHSLFSSLSLAEQNNIIARVNSECLAQTDWKFLSEALDHSKEIMTLAVMATLVAGVGTYTATGNPLTSLAAAVFSGATTGMLALSAYQHQSEEIDMEQRKRLKSMLRN